MHTTELANVPPAQLEPAPVVNIIADAIAKGAAPDTLKALLDLRREYEADEARKAFNHAVSEFQRRCPIVPKADKAHNKLYAKYDRIWRTIRPLLTELGLSVAWQVAELRNGLCHVEGVLRHRDGHSDPLRMDVPLPEIVQSQNAAQQMGSAFTYAQRYALCAALGVVTGDDDDGEAAGATLLSHEEAMEIDALLADVRRVLPSFNEVAFWGWAKATQSQDIERGRFHQITTELRKKLAEGGAK